MAVSDHKDQRVIREHLVRLLFLRDFHEADELEEQYQLYFDEFFPSEEINSDVDVTNPNLKDKVLEKLHRLVKRLPEIDFRLTKEMQSWSLRRIGLAEKSILRLSVFEMVYDHVPVKVSINEAVELAKKYGGDRAYGFVNGVLAKVVKGFDNNGQQSSTDKD